MIMPNRVPTGIDFFMCSHIDSVPIATGSLRKADRQYPITKPSVTRVSNRNKIRYKTRLRAYKPPKLIL